MKYKPNPEILIEYLYGETTTEQNRQIEAYFAVNPEAEQQFKAMQKTHQIMMKMPEPALTPKAIPMPIANQTKHTGFIMRMASIAATFLLLLTAAWIMDFQIHKQGDAWQVGFGIEPKTIAMQMQEDTKTEKNLPNEINSQEIRQSQDSLQQMLVQMTERLAKLEQRPKVVQTATTKSIDEETLKIWLAQNRKQSLEDALKLVGFTQKAQEKQLLQMFNEYVQFAEKQRRKDLNIIQESIDDWQDYTLFRQMKTEEAVAKMVSSK
ncbi:MAG: hypothetical protein JJT94_16330 [Bernardetiaceae bacterium]|nr:hypothetical protein [Bernardetiaceae bacterium]